MKLYLEKLITGLTVMLLGMVMTFLTTTQIREASLAGVSPRAVPYLVARCILILALCMIGQSLWLFYRERKSGRFTLSEVRFHSFPFFVYLLMLAYAVIMVYAGYFLASFIVLPFMMYVLKERRFRNYLIMAALVLFIFLVIDVFLKIRLPKIGLWGIL